MKLPLSRLIIFPDVVETRTSLFKNESRK